MGIQFPTISTADKFSVGMLLDVNKFAGLETPGGDFTPAAQAAMAYAVANNYDGVYFPERPTPYLLSNCPVPPSCKVISSKQATLSPFGFAYTIFNITGSHNEFVLGNCVGKANFQVTNADGTLGVGAIVFCQLVIVTAGSPPVLGLQAGADSTYDDLTIPDWQPSTHYLGLDVNGDPQSRAKLQPSKSIWSSLIDHISDPTSMINDIIAGIWVATQYGLTLSGGGYNYQATASEAPGSDPKGVGGPYLDYNVVEANNLTGVPGTGGVLRCYTNAGIGQPGQIIRVRVTAQGSGYRANSLTDVNRVMTVGGALPSTRWINGQNVTSVVFPPPPNQTVFPFSDLTVRDSSFLYGQLPVLAMYASHVKILRNYMGYLQGGGVNLINCDDYTVEDNFIEECWGSQSNGVSLGSFSSDLRLRAVLRGVVSHNKIRRCIGGDGCGIHSNAAVIDSLVIEGNILELNETGCTLKHGWNSNTYTPGTADENDVGHHGITLAGNVVRVPAGFRGFAFHNNMRDAYQILVDDSNVIESVGAKVNPVTGSVTTAVTVINCMNSTFSPTIVGRFYVGIWVEGAYNCTFQPITDGRSDICVYAAAGRSQPVHLCRFPGEYLANKVALQIFSGTKPIFEGARAQVRGRPINSITIAAGGSGGLPNAVIPVYLHGGGVGLQIQCTVVNGVITKAAYIPAGQEMMFGVDYFDGGNGTYYVKVLQNGGSGAAIKVPIAMGQGVDPDSTYFTASIAAAVGAALPIMTVTAINALAVSAGVTTRATLVIGQYINGKGVLQGQNIADQITGTPGGAGTYHVRLSQTLASTPMKALYPFQTRLEVQLDLVDPVTHAVVTSGGSNYLGGGSTTADLPLLVEMGGDFVGTVTTDGTGVVVSTTIIDAGGHFRDVPDFAFESNVTWGTAPTLTAVLATGNVQGMQLRNVYGGQLANAHLEGGVNGLWMYGETVQGLDIIDTEFRSDVGEPLLIDGTDHLGVTRGITLIYGTGVARTPVAVTQSGTAAFKSWSRGEDNLINSASAVMIKNILGMTSVATYRASSPAGLLTFDNTTIPATTKALTVAVPAAITLPITSAVLAPINRFGVVDHPIGATVLHVNDVTNIAAGMWVSSATFPGVPNGVRVLLTNAPANTVTVNIGLVGPLATNSQFYFHSARLPVSSTAGLAVGQRVTSSVTGIRPNTKILTLLAGPPMVEMDGPVTALLPSGTNVVFSNATLQVAAASGVSPGQLATCPVAGAIPSATTVDTVDTGTNVITLNNGVALLLPIGTVITFAALTSNLYLKGQNQIVLDSTDDFATFQWNGTLNRVEFIGSNNDIFTSIYVDQGVITVRDPVIFAASTWNNAATSFFGFEMDIVDQASQSSSRLLTFYVGPTGPGLVEVFTVRKDGAVSIGPVGAAGISLSMTKNVTGSASSYGVYNAGIVQSDVTAAQYYRTNAATAAALANLSHYVAAQGTLVGALTNQYGFSVQAGFAATNNYGFYGALAAATNTYNIYMAGTAFNYLAGPLGLNATTLAGFGLRSLLPITGGVFSRGASMGGAVQSDVTSGAYYYETIAKIAGAVFTTNIYHYMATQAVGGFAGGGTVTNQHGFYAENSLTDATNNYGAFLALTSAANRWNLYAAGTADNYMAGGLGIGITGSTTAFSKLNVSWSVTDIATLYNLMQATGTHTMTSNNAQQLRGINAQAVVNQGAFNGTFGFVSGGSVIGMRSTAQMNGASGTVSGLTGVLSGIINSGAGTLTVGAAYIAAGATNNGGGAFTTHYGYYAAASTGATNNYGFFSALVAAANTWNYYAVGTAANFFAGDLTIYGNTAIPAGGTAGTGYKFSSATNYGIFFGSAAPSLAAAQGSLYLRSNGVPSFNVAGSTGWCPVADTSITLVTAATYIVLDNDTNLVMTFAGAVVLTLPNPATYANRKIRLLLQTANAVTSASANVLPLLGGSAGTAIMPATAGKYSTLVSTGAAWQIMASN